MSYEVWELIGWIIAGGAFIGLGTVLAILIFDYGRTRSQIEALRKEKHSSLNRFSVPYDQALDDDKSKRQPYMTIGDDGELVEMDE